jgi:hypothetical protein
MDEQTRAKLISAGREDLIKAYEITASGWAGVDRNGTIVDRREYPKAVPIPENKMLGVPPPRFHEEEDPDFFAGGGLEYE